MTHNKQVVIEHAINAYQIGVGKLGYSEELVRLIFAQVYDKAYQKGKHDQDHK